MKPGEFKEFLKENFALVLPKGIQISKDSGSAVRVYSESLNGVDLPGARGFTAYSKKTGISSDFIQIFGKYAKKNIVKLNEKEALEFANGGKIRKKLFMKKGIVIVSFKDNFIGIGTFDGRIIHSKIKEKRKRRIWNSI